MIVDHVDDDGHDKGSRRHQNWLGRDIVGIARLLLSSSIDYSSRN
jgi:hypothetical protein